MTEPQTQFGNPPKRERKKALTLTDEVERLKGEIKGRENRITLLENIIMENKQKITELHAQIEAAGNRRLAEAVVVLGKMMTEGKGE